MKTYKGERSFDGAVVTVNSELLDARRDLHTFSQNNFEWGYVGAESRQLALAILADCESDDVAIRFVEAFTDAIVANFSNEWEMNQNHVREAIAALSVSVTADKTNNSS